MMTDDWITSVYGLFPGRPCCRYRFVTFGFARLLMSHPRQRGALATDLGPSELGIRIDTRDPASVLDLSTLELEPCQRSSSQNDSQSPYTSRARSRVLHLVDQTRCAGSLSDEQVAVASEAQAPGSIKVSVPASLRRRPTIGGRRSLSARCVHCRE